VTGDRQRLRLRLRRWKTNGIGIWGNWRLGYLHRRDFEYNLNFLNGRYDEN